MSHYQSFTSRFLKFFLSISIAALLTTPALSVAPAADDLTGTWGAEIETPIGTQKYQYVIKQEGTVLTGKIIMEIESQKSETDLLEGKFTDGTITFLENMNIGGEAIRVTYKGKLEEGNINFTREVGEFGTETFVAKRVKPETK